MERAIVIFPYYLYLCAIMNRGNRIIATIAVALMLLAPTSLRAQEQELIKLDHALDISQTYIDTHNAYILELNTLLGDSSLSLQRRYDVLCSLYEAYRSFQFDKAIETLYERESVARQLGNDSLLDDVDLDRAQLYSMAGMFLESHQVLDNNIDTLRLNKRQLIRYYDVQQRFYSNFSDYTSDAHTRDQSFDMRSYYRNRILELSDPTDEIYQQMVVANHIECGEYEAAERVNLEILSKYQPHEHEYAMFAYDQARICEQLERRADMKMWLARSAMADICSATKDHASLCSLAQLLITENDIDRAFRYVTISLNDALFYNAKLRPWQISAIIPEIEGAYADKQRQNLLRQEEHQRILEDNQRILEEKEEHSRQQARIISILAVALFIICVFLVISLLRSRKAARKIHNMNERIGNTNTELQELNTKLASVNSDLREANAVKEEYIALFLSMCSDYIEKITSLRRNVRRKISQGKVEELDKELSSSSYLDEELNSFYEMFDNAFLSLYPNFVEEFNAMLKPDAHIELKRGERLNTELRIFALIRLGITDSSRIAALLRYSVNTIYNYRARTKNNALVDRDTFEERIKTIGR